MVLFYLDLWLQLKSFIYCVVESSLNSVVLAEISGTQSLNGNTKKKITTNYMRNIFFLTGSSYLGTNNV